MQRDVKFEYLFLSKKESSILIGPNLNQHRNSGFKWLPLYPVLDWSSLEVFLGKRTFVPLPWVRFQPAQWDKSQAQTLEISVGLSSPIQWVGSSIGCLCRFHPLLGQSLSLFHPPLFLPRNTSSSPSYHSLHTPALLTSALLAARDQSTVSMEQHRPPHHCYFLSGWQKCALIYRVAQTWGWSTNGRAAQDWAINHCYYPSKEISKHRFFEIPYPIHVIYIKVWHFIKYSVGEL